MQTGEEVKSTGFAKKNITARAHMSLLLLYNRIQSIKNTFRVIWKKEYLHKVKFY